MMKLRTQSQAEALVVVVFLVISMVMVEVRPASGFEESVALGSRMEIGGDGLDGEAAELGRFAVDEYNKQQQMSGGAGVRGPKPAVLQFKQVVAENKQVIAGIKYYLKIIAIEDGVEKMFNAEVAVTPWERSQELLSFAPAS